jgi:hypothetical protein
MSLLARVKAAIYPFPAFAGDLPPPDPLQHAVGNAYILHGKQEALIRQPGMDSPMLLLMQGVAQRELDDAEAALACWRKAYALAPELPDARMFLLSGLHEAGLTDDADYDALLESLTVPPGSFTLDARNADADAITQALETYGAVLLRRAVPERDAALHHEYMQDNMSRARALISRYVEPDFASLPAWFACAHDMDVSFEQRLLDAFAGGYTQVAFASADEVEALDALAHALLSGPLRTAATEALRGAEPELRLTRSQAFFLKGQGGGHLASQEARTDGSQALSLTCWLAFSAYGRNAPARAVSPVRLHHLFPAGEGGLISPAALPLPLWHLPEYEPGDALITTPFTLRGLIAHEGMAQAGASLDMRLG